ncbi:MAG: hypothetical protein N4A72_22220 [Bacteroidales bacterium]|jgi:hypothetical protein|nr:hypothetical protein [Bacteroidales bacterium]
MKHLLKTNLLALFAIIIFISCSKDEFDTDKISKDIKWSPDFVIPIAYAEYKTSDVLNNKFLDSDNLSIIFDGDELAHLRFGYQDLFKVDFDKIISSSEIDMNVVEIDLPPSLIGNIPGLPSDITITPADTEISLNMNNGIKLLNVNCGFSMQISVSNPLQTDIVLTTQFSNIIKDGQQLTINHNIPANSNYFNEVDLTDLLIDFSADYPVNNIKMSSAFVVKSTGNTISTTSSDKIHFGTKLLNLKITEAKGDFGKQVLSFPTAKIDYNFDLWSEHDADVEFTDPSLQLSFVQSMSVPFMIDIDITGYDKNNNATELQFDPLMPETSQSANEFTSIFSINKTNSDIDVFFRKPEYDKLEYDATVELNPNPVDVTSNPNFIKSNSSIGVNISIDLPLKFKITQYQVGDTLDISTDLTDLNRAKMIIISENGLPVDISLSRLYIADSRYNKLDSITDVTIFEAAPVFTSGNSIGMVDTTKINKVTSTVELTKSFISHMNDNTKIIIVGATQSFNEGNTTVALHSFNKLKLKMILEATLE